MNVLMILPALTEAKGPFWRPIKYSLFPPLGLATLTAYLDRDHDNVHIIDEHVHGDVSTECPLDIVPDLVVIQVYITNAKRAYRLADYFRSLGSFVALGGLHVTSLPGEARVHADTIFLGPGEQTFLLFLQQLRAGSPAAQYDSTQFARTLVKMPPIRRDLIDRKLYLVPNSIVVTRGCPFHCDFCYKDTFFQGGKTFYTQTVDDALAEIERLPGRHLYFLDDHLLGNRVFARGLFDGMRGMNRLFQGAATVDSILKDDLIEHATAAGLRSIFIGFESLDATSLASSDKRQNIGKDYAKVIKRLDDLGVMINGSFVFGLDGDGPDVFKRTVDWAVNSGIATATFHVATPYPGTGFFKRIESQNRLLTRDWDLYDTRHAVFQPVGMAPTQLEEGYHWAYKQFYTWRNIATASQNHASVARALKHFCYAAGWKKFERVWNFAIKTRQLHVMRPMLEGVLSRVRRRQGGKLVRLPEADLVQLNVTRLETRQS